MSQCPNPGNYLLGRGLVYFDAGDTGVERSLGHTVNFAMNVSSETVKHENLSEPLIIIDKTIPAMAEASFSFTLDEANDQNLSLLFLGGVEIRNQEAKTDSVFAITDVEKGVFYRIGENKNITVSSVESNPAGTIYVLGTDYKIESGTGRVYITKDSTIPVGSDIDVTYSCPALDVDNIVAMSDLVKNGRFRFIGNPASGIAYDVNIYDVYLVPAGELPLIGKSWATMSFTGTINKSSKVEYADNPYFTMRAI